MKEAVADLACPFLRNQVDIEAVIIRNALRRERIFRPRLDILSFPEEYLCERYRFSSNSLIYLNNILRPHITNLTHRGHVKLQILLKNVKKCEWVEHCQ